MIGIVGGVGPYAGLDLARKVFDHTLAGSDQEHLPLILLSLPATIPDRTAYLLGEVAENPGRPLAAVIGRLATAGSTVAGIACNTAHAPAIYNQIVSQLQQQQVNIELLNLVAETIRFIKRHYPGSKKIGILSTTGSYRFGVYSEPLQQAGLQPIVPDTRIQEVLVHAAIYHPEYGIKAQTNPVHLQARAQLLQVAGELVRQGAELIIKGCTEIVLALPEEQLHGVPAVDPAVALARSLIRHFNPNKLKPL